LGRSRQKILLGGWVRLLNSPKNPARQGIGGLGKGDRNATLVASFINLLVAKEAEGKKVGQEVLILYRR
jgi:hypothetical protein